MTERRALAAVLLVDTCGERGTVALVKEGRIAAEVTLAERGASAGLLAVVRDVLGADGISLEQLSGIGVANGPGSFTGVRVGLAVCKGLCEAAALPIAAVSRLAVLARAAGLREGFAVLRAGRDQVYARAVSEGGEAYERLIDASTLAGCPGEIVYTEAELEPLLQALGARIRHVPFSAADACELVQQQLAEGGTDLALVDANYVRDEEATYARPQRVR